MKLNDAACFSLSFMEFVRVWPLQPEQAGFAWVQIEREVETTDLHAAFRNKLRVVAESKSRRLSKHNRILTAVLAGIMWQIEQVVSPINWKKCDRYKLQNHSCFEEKIWTLIDCLSKLLYVVVVIRKIRECEEMPSGKGRDFAE